MTTAAGPNPVRPLVWYGAAVALIVLFIQTFPVWQFLSAALGRAAAGIIPIAALAGTVGFLSVGVIRVNRAQAHRWLGRWQTVFPALIIAGTALALVAPDLPAKRIHIPQYMLVAALIRAALTRSPGTDSLTGWQITLSTAGLTALLGVHDELAQGLHPDRTFGFRDIGINTLGGLAGALLLHLPAGPGNPPPAAAHDPGLAPWHLILPAAFTALGLQIGGIALTLSPDGLVPPPLWSTAPVLGVTAAATLLGPRHTAGVLHPGWLCILLIALTPFPLVIAHAAPLAFR